MNKRLVISLIILLMVIEITQAATIVVNTNDLTVIADDGLCTLYEAVDAVNMNTASGSTVGECVAGESHPVVDVIQFDPDILPANFFPFAPFVLTESVDIQGPGTDLMSVSSIDISRAFVFQNLNVGTSFKLSGMTLQFNTLLSSISDYGGAILATLIAEGALTLENVYFYQNTSERGGGAIGLFGGNNNLITIRDCVFEENNTTNFNNNVVGGGAIFIGAGQTVVIENSTFMNNFTLHGSLDEPQSDAAGGAILMRSNAVSPSSLTIWRSTFSGNHTMGVGGALALGGPGFPDEHSELTIRHSTITLNEADSNDDQMSITGGGGLWSASVNATNVFNSIIALNTDRSNIPAADISGSTASFGHNLIGDNSFVTGTFPAGQPNANDDWVGVAFVVLDPQLQPLGNNGGRTPTHIPLSDSIVLDQGKCISQMSDQRRYQNANTSNRAVDLAGINNADDGCDIGATELQTTSANPIPVAADDVYEMLEGQLLMIPAANGLLANDSDNDPLLVNSAGLLTIEADADQIAGEADIHVNGSFTFFSDDADDYGQTSFAYQITDSFNTSEAQVTLTILPVNDAPSFSTGQTHLITDPGVPELLNSWATEMSPGPTNEATQSTVFVVTLTDVPNGFFSSFPTVSNTTGDLSFALAEGASGMAEISITLRDDGGIDNGGINEAKPVSVFIQASDAIFVDDFE